MSVQARYDLKIRNLKGKNNIKGIVRNGDAFFASETLKNFLNLEADLGRLEISTAGGQPTHEKLIPFTIRGISVKTPKNFCHAVTLS